jgi:hypothetical protein
MSASNLQTNGFSPNTLHAALFFFYKHGCKSVIHKPEQDKIEESLGNVIQACL